MFHPAYLRDLRNRKEAASRLCAALLEFLTVGIDDAIEKANRKPPKPPRPTIEDLNRAQQDVDVAHSQLEALEKLSEHMPEAYGEAFIEAQRPAIERLLKPLEDRVAAIQKALEEPDDPDSPWDGSHHIGTLCAQCARPYEGVEHSVPALKTALKAAGWGRDEDGDHICPDCASKAAGGVA
jgi:hypothetical protein